MDLFVFITELLVAEVFQLLEDLGTIDALGMSEVPKPARIPSVV